MVPLEVSILAAPVKTTGGAFESGVPQPLLVPPPSSAYDVTADGQHFLFAQTSSQGARRPSITLVLNWLTLATK